MSEPMDAISLWQPYASLIVAGVKPYETRHWCAPTRVIGQRIAIHAAKRKPSNAEIDALNIAVVMSLGEGWWQNLPLGAVVGTAILDGCFETGARYDFDMIRLIGDGEIEDDYLGDYSPGRWVWRMKNPVQFATPIPALGRQNFWRWTPP